MFTYYTGITAPVWLIWMMAGFLAILSLPVVSKRGVSGVIFQAGLLISMFLIGQLRSHQQDSRNFDHYFASSDSLWKARSYMIFISGDPEEKENSVAAVAEVYSVNEQISQGKLLVYFEKTSASRNLKYGDCVLLNTGIQEPQKAMNPRAFDFREYLRRKDIHHQTYVKQDQWQLTENKGAFLKRSVIGIRTFFSGLFDHPHIGEEHADLCRALILGQKEGLDGQTRAQFSDAGAMHVLAVSGLHVGILMLVMSFLLKPIKKLPGGKKIFLLLVLSTLWFYALITGFSPSVLRASVMFSFILIGSQLEREVSSFQSLLVAAFLLIIFDPFLLFNVGFQLSFLAVAGILYLYPLIYRSVFVKHWVLNRIWQLLAVSMAAQLATFPLGLYYFHQFPNYFLLTNLFVVPMAFLVLAGGLLFLITSLMPVVADFSALLLDFIVLILLKGVQWISEIPLSRTSGVVIHVVEMLGLYASIALAAYFWKRKKKKSLIGIVTVTVAGMIAGPYFHSARIQTDELVIYSTKDRLAMDQYTNGHHQYYSTIMAEEGDRILEFACKEFWMYKTGKELPADTRLISDSLTIIETGSFSILQLTDLTSSTDLSQMGIIDMVLIRNAGFIPSQTVEYIISLHCPVIIGDQVSFRLKKYLDKMLPAPVKHNLQSDGAFRLKI